VCANARRPAGIVQRLHDRLVVGGIDHDEHVVEVLCCRADQARTTDVDLLHQVVEADLGPCGSLGKWIQIDDHEVDGQDAVAGQRAEVARVIATRQDAGMNHGMQRLDAAVHHFRKAGQRRHLDHRQAGRGQRGRRAAGRDELPP
jgi:hypothetical protein